MKPPGCDEHARKLYFPGVQHQGEVTNRLRTAAVDGSTTATIRYDYDPLGRRISKTVGGVTTLYLLDADEEIAELDSSGAVLRRYVMGPGVDDRVAWIEGGSVTPAASARKYYHVNHQGSVLGLSAASGTISQRLAYDEYGVASAATAPTGQPYRYTGRRFDEETGLYYYRARYYAPEMGRFLQTDPVGYQDQLNLYAYVHNDPINNIDPNGEVAFGIASKIVKVAIKGGDIGATLAGAAADGRTLTSSSATLGQRAGALVSLASEIASPVSLRDAKAGASAVQAAAGKGGDFFRGAKGADAPSFTPKPGEFKVDPATGTVKPTHGVSVFDNADSVASKGLTPHKVDQSTVPDSLQIIQRGNDKSHFEITPKPGENLTPDQFKEALECIKCLQE